MKIGIGTGVIATVFGLGVAAGTGHAGLFNTAASATTPSSSSRGAAMTQWCNDFAGHLTSDLGVSESKLVASLKQAADQTIDDAVAQGKLTSAQAAALKARVASVQSCSDLAKLGPMGHDGRGGPAAAFLPKLLDDAASALGISTSQLQSDIQSGMTLDQIATKQGVSQSTFDSRLSASLKQQLDQLVAAQKMTSATEQTILGKVSSTVAMLWDRKLDGGLGMALGGFGGGFHGRGGFGGFHGMPGAPGAPGGAGAPAPAGLGFSL